LIHKGLRTSWFLRDSSITDIYGNFLIRRDDLPDQGVFEFPEGGQILPEFVIPLDKNEQKRLEKQLDSGQNLHVFSTTGREIEPPVSAIEQLNVLDRGRYLIVNIESNRKAIIVVP
jgi:hypothetical protein